MHDHTDRTFFVDDLKHVFQRQWLEIQSVGSIKVGRYSLGIAVDHNGFIAIFTHRESGMHTAIVELNALTDTVRTAAQHHDFFLVGGIGFALFLIGRVHICRIRCKFTGTGINALINRTHIQHATQFADLAVFNFQQFCQTTIREAFAFQSQQRVFVEYCHGLGFQPEFDIDQFLDLRQKPGIDLGQLMHFFLREALGKGIAHIPDALRSRLA